MTDTCPFCKPDSERIWFEDESGFVLRDAYPLAQGHALVVFKQHNARLYDFPADTQAALWQLVSEARRRIDEELRSDGFNIGVNDGEAAGQTVMHAHIHVIPRWTDDVTDPRGAIRWAISEKSWYWVDE